MKVDEKLGSPFLLALHHCFERAGWVGRGSLSVDCPGRDDDGRVNGDGASFTIAMESGASVVRSIEHVLVRSDDASATPLPVRPPTQTSSSGGGAVWCSC